MSTPTTIVLTKAIRMSARAVRAGIGYEKALRVAATALRFSYEKLDNYYNDTKEMAAINARERERMPILRLLMASTSAEKALLEEYDYEKSLKRATRAMKDISKELCECYAEISDTFAGQLEGASGIERELLWDGIRIQHRDMSPDILDYFEYGEAAGEWVDAEE